MRAIAVFFLLVLGHLALCQGAGVWKCAEGPQLFGAFQIDAGLGQVVAVDEDRHAYFLSGSSWTRLPNANLTHISVGEGGLWGIQKVSESVSERIYKYVGGNWALVSGSLKQVEQVDAGGDGYVVGANKNNNVYCLRGADTVSGGGVPWLQLEGRMKYFSCGPYGCWGVNSNDQNYFKKLTSAADCKFEDWKRIYVTGLLLTTIEVGSDGKAFGVNRVGNIYERVGITKDLPEGSDWKQIPVCLAMRQVSYDLGTIFGLSKGGVVLKCTTA